MSNHTGKFDWSSTSQTRHSFVLLCAGTGVTPMVKLTLDALRIDPSNHVHMVFFNKTEADIQWRDQLDQLETIEHPRFSVVQVLSQEPDWQGRKGRMSKELLMELIGSRIAEDDAKLVCVCGPHAFTDATLG